jgi:hypothetical protein
METFKAKVIELNITNDGLFRVGTLGQIHYPDATFEQVTEFLAVEGKAYRVLTVAIEHAGNLTGSTKTGDPLLAVILALFHLQSCVCQHSL